MFTTTFQRDGFTVSAKCYTAYVAGYSFDGATLADVQKWLDNLRHNVVGETLTVYEKRGCVLAHKPCVQGPVTA